MTWGRREGYEPIVSPEGGHATRSCPGSTLGARPPSVSRGGKWHGSWCRGGGERGNNEEGDERDMIVGRTIWTPAASKQRGGGAEGGSERRGGGMPRRMGRAADDAPAGDASEVAGKAQAQTAISDGCFRQAFGVQHARRLAIYHGRTTTSPRHRAALPMESWGARGPIADEVWRATLSAARIARGRWGVEARTVQSCDDRAGVMMGGHDVWRALAIARADEDARCRCGRWGR